MKIFLQTFLKSIVCHHLFFCLFWLLSFTFLSPLCAEDVEIKLVKIKGEVKVRIPPSKEWSTGEEGMLLKKGTSIKTGLNSEATILWAEENIQKIYPLTIVTIKNAEYSPQTGDENSLTLIEKGKLYAKAKKLRTPESTYIVETPLATAGVRGSELFCEIIEENKVNFSIIEGQFNIIAEGGERIIEEKFQISIEKGIELPEPQPIPEETLQMLRKETEEIKQSVYLIEREEKKDAKDEKEEIKKIEKTKNKEALEKDLPKKEALETEIIEKVIEKKAQEEIEKNILYEHELKPGTGGINIEIK